VTAGSSLSAYFICVYLRSFAAKRSFQAAGFQKRLYVAETA
jgi:hypothetical protein